MGRRKKVRTEPVRPICPQCEKQFSNQSALTKHKLTHSDERKFACQQCSKAFKRHDHLTGHMQTHSNRKPFNCNIQGCDKTYCDARSLRRHKENIHHIVTLKDNNTQNTDQNNNNNNSTYDTSSQHPNDAMPSPSLPNGTTMVQQPSHLLSRRIQRLQQQQHAYPAEYVTLKDNNIQNTDQNNNNNSTYDTSSQHPNGAMPSPSLPNGTTMIQQPSHLLSRRIQRLQQQQHAYSADYASAPHFSFDFSNPPVAANSDQQFCQNGSIPHSADSINDSSLGLSTQYEQIAPNSAPYDQSQGCSGFVTPSTNHYNNHHQHQQHAYSADYASTQHFSFDFRNPPVTTTSDQQFCQNGSMPHSADSINDSSLGLSTHYEQITPNSAPYDQSQGCSGFATPSTNHYNNHHQHQQHAYSADYASTQHFSFDFRNPPVTTTSDQQFCQNGSMPHSADSINDSSLGLSTHYEQITPNSAHHDQYQRCGGYITHTTLHPMDHDITQSQNHGQVYQVKHE